MRFFAKIKNLVRRGINKLSNSVRTTLNLGATLIGLRYIDERWEYRQLVVAGWTFILGLPVGSILLGPQFSVFIWGVTIITVLIMHNLDHTINNIIKKE